MKPIAFEKNEILFGSDATEGIVAVEPAGERSMRLFIRRERKVETIDEPFSPFILLEDEKLLEGLKIPHKVERLSDSNAFRLLILFESWSECLRARDHLRKVSGQMPSSPEAPYLFFSDPVQQYLILSGKTLFKGMAFSDIHRLALDIETGCAAGFEFSNPARESDRIISIALMDSRGYEEVLFASEMDEKQMLRELGERISRLDPDVLEGHNIFNFDLEYIVARARMHGVRLGWGRGGGLPRIRPSRFSLAERTIDYSRMDLFGRHIVDTLFLLQHYDITAREMESYGLKAAAIHFGLADQDRTYIEPEKIQWYFENDPKSLKRYNLDDVRETLALSELLGYPFFLQTRIFPLSYQNVFVRGNATKINALFMREYLRQRASIPKPSGRGPLEGGYTDVFEQGIVKNVVHCDVASLYPSIMLSYEIKPEKDTLGIFLPLLKDLRTFRLEAKRGAQQAQSKNERDYLNGLQQTFKILINSFYGYLGTELHHFSDAATAAKVTRLGREIIHRMLDWLRGEGAVPVEIDTDGIYFVPPPGKESEKDAEELVKRLSKTLPEGIDVEMDGRYPAMFSYKMKNYALLDESGDVVIRGSGLRSRGIEKYLREFLWAMIRLLLEGRGEKVYDLYRETVAKLERHEIGISNLAKTETLTESPESYRQKIKARKRNRAATYELALASGRDYRAGDQISYYVTGEGKRVRVFESCSMASSYNEARPNENVAYYEAKLLDLLKKFQDFLPPDPARKKGQAR